MKKILLSALCLVSILFFGSSHALAAPMVIKAATAHPSGSISANLYIALGQAITERSNGRFKMEVFDNAKLGSVATSIQALQAGTVHMNMDATSQLTSFAPILNIYDTPYLIPNFDEAAVKVVNGETSKKILEQSSNKRMVFLGIFSCFPRYMETTRQLHSLEDAKGLKMRTTQSKMHVAIMQAFGMAPIPMTSSEVVTSLQQGVIEGVDYGLNPSIAIGYHSMAPYWSKWDHQLIISPICVNRKWWETKLTEEDRQFLLETINEFSVKAMQEDLAYEKDTLAKLEAEGKPVFIPSAEEKARWVDASKNVHLEFAKEFDPALVDEFRAEYNAIANANN